MAAFTPSGIVTSEVCPACWEPGVEVEHGYAVDIDAEGNVKVDTARHRHLWHCPECGDELVNVAGCKTCESINST